MIRDKIRSEWLIWRGAAIPGLLVLFVVMVTRGWGGIQVIELSTWDLMMRSRPHEEIDDRIVIIGVDEEDIKTLGRYPVPDSILAQLLTKLDRHQARAVGLDIVRDQRVEPGHQALMQIFQDQLNVIGVEKSLPPTISPPPALPSHQIGFVDYLPDADGNVRRALLGMSKPSQELFQFSFASRLVKLYLAKENITLINGIKDPNAFRFGSVELPRFYGNDGGYSGAADFGVQILLNPRNCDTCFKTISLQEALSSSLDPDLFSDRIVLIGMTTPSAQDYVNTRAIHDLDLPGEIYGVQFHAQVISQILSAVLDERAALRTWSDPVEYLWIFAWGLGAIWIGRMTQSALKNFLILGVLMAVQMGLGYGLLLMGWVLPTAPVVLILGLNAVGLSAFSFFTHDRALKAQVRAREETIKSAFRSIHNGPLQRLAVLMKRTQDAQISQEDLFHELSTLNQEIRQVSEYLLEESVTQTNRLYLGSKVAINLTHPLHELFYEIFRTTLERDLPYFQSLTIKVRSFDPCETHGLSLEQKRELCQWFEEALCNVGKHAQAVTRLVATGRSTNGRYQLLVQDNGQAEQVQPLAPKQGKILAKRLKGTFRYEAMKQGGFIAVLEWPLHG